jgi:hypothetical protein
MGIPEDPSLKPRTCFVYGPNPLAFRTIPAWDPSGKKYKDILIKKDTEVHPLSHLAAWVRCKLRASLRFGSTGFPINTTIPQSVWHKKSCFSLVTVDIGTFVEETWSHIYKISKQICYHIQNINSLLNNLTQQHPSLILCESYVKRHKPLSTSQLVACAGRRLNMSVAMFLTGSYILGGLPTDNCPSSLNLRLKIYIELENRDIDLVGLISMATSFAITNTPDGATRTLIHSIYC